MGITAISSGVVGFRAVCGIRPAHVLSSGSPRGLVVSSLETRDIGGLLRIDPKTPNYDASEEEMDIDRSTDSVAPANCVFVALEDRVLATTPLSISPRIVGNGNKPGREMARYLVRVGQQPVSHRRPFHPLSCQLLHRESFRRPRLHAGTSPLPLTAKPCFLVSGRSNRARTALPIPMRF